MSRAPTRPARPPSSPGWHAIPAMLYPNEYVWFLLLSSMDIMLTWVILELGGTEVNPIAALVIYEWGLPGAIGFKFSLMLAVIVICEVVGRQRPQLGRTLATIAIAVSAFPVVWSLSLLSWHVFVEIV